MGTGITDLWLLTFTKVSTSSLNCSIHLPISLGVPPCIVQSISIRRQWLFFFVLQDLPLYVTAFFFFFFSNTQADIFCFKQDHFEIPLREAFYFLPKRAQTKTLLVVFNRRAREEFLLRQLRHYSLIFYDKLDLKFFHQTERLVDVKKHLVAL